MRTLTIAIDNFDRVNTFNVEVKSALGRMHNVKASLHRDYHKRGDGILWMMQHSACIASSYTAEQIAERERLNAEEPIRNGDVVIVDGAQYRVDVKGDPQSVRSCVMAMAFDETCAPVYVSEPTHAEPDSLRETCMEYLRANNWIEAERWLHAYTNPLPGYPVIHNGVWTVYYRRPLVTRLFGYAPRYLRSPEKAIMLVQAVSLTTPNGINMDTDDVVRAALAKVAKQNTFYWGCRASLHISFAIVLEMLNRIQQGDN